MQDCHWSQEADASGLPAPRDAGSFSPAALHVTSPQGPRTPQSQTSPNSHRRLHRKSRMSLTLAGHLPLHVRVQAQLWEHPSQTTQLTHWSPAVMMEV